MSFLALFLVMCVAQEFYTAPAFYTASYGPYYAEIPVNDRYTDPGFDGVRYGSTYDHHQRAQDRAQETQEDQRNTYWN